jgi:hypothetical protein
MSPLCSLLLLQHLATHMVFSRVLIFSYIIALFSVISTGELDYALYQ